ncbi:hypothetical protein GCM10022223_06610 [Kineosporia mesophila]|uniref:MFS transporter n=2 Tax=Kineosporia mesophila TaxID=566012 RepID=A0ABP6Z000_9ACTN
MVAWPTKRRSQIVRASQGSRPDSSSAVAAHTAPGGVATESGFTTAFVLMAALAAVSVGAAVLVPAATRIDRRTLVRAPAGQAEEAPVTAN